MTGCYGSDPEDRYFESQLFDYLDSQDIRPPLDPINKENLLNMREDTALVHCLGAAIASGHSYLDALALVIDTFNLDRDEISNLEWEYDSLL